jgi:hypothetical protein
MGAEITPLNAWALMATIFEYFILFLHSGKLKRNSLTANHIHSVTVNEESVQYDLYDLYSFMLCRYTMALPAMWAEVA